MKAQELFTLASNKPYGPSSKVVMSARMPNSVLPKGANLLWQKEGVNCSASKELVGTGTGSLD